MIGRTIFTGWHFTRWLRLILGISISFQAVESRDILSGCIAAFLLFQAITNTGCCGNGACAAGMTKNPDEDEEIKFNEIKND